MPTDKESVVWLNVQEIPQTSSKANTLQLAVRQRIKVFFRPENLPGDALKAPEQLSWKLSSGRTQLTVKNPSLYHVSMADVTLQDGDNTELAVDSIMVAPGEEKIFEIKKIKPYKEVRLSFKSINDYGAQKDYATVLIEKYPSNAKATAPTPAP